MARKPSNIIKTTIDLSLNEEQRRQAFRWINVQHTGKETVPLDTKIKLAPEHVGAGYTLCRGRRIEVEVEVSKNGDLKIITIGGRKVV